MKDIYEEKPLNLADFVELLFVSLANKMSIMGNRKPIFFPFEYLRIIEEIMYDEKSSWKIKFSKLIDSKRYYKNQSDWELDLGRVINKYLMDKKVTYDFCLNYFSFDITPEEIETVLKKYDEKMIEIMEHFTNLLTDCCYERNFSLQTRELNHREQELKRDLLKNTTNS